MINSNRKLSRFVFALFISVNCFASPEDDQYKQLAEEFVAGISDLVEQGDEMLETPPGEEKDLNYVITALDNIVGGASRNLLASRLSAVDGVEQGAATLVDGLLDGLKSGNLLAEIPAILGQTGNTLAYAEAQAFLDQIGSGLGDDESTPKLTMLENGDDPCEDLENFGEGVGFFVKEQIGEVIGSVAIVESNVESAIELPLDIVESLVSGDYNGDLVGGLINSLGENVQKLRVKAGDAEVKALKSVFL